MRQFSNEQQINKTTQPVISLAADFNVLSYEPAYFGCDKHSRGFTGFLNNDGGNS